MQKYFKERENYGNKAETCYDVPFLDCQLSADVNNAERVLGIGWDVGNDGFVRGYNGLHTHSILTTLALTLSPFSKNIFISFFASPLTTF